MYPGNSGGFLSYQLAPWLWVCALAEGNSTITANTSKTLPSTHQSHVCFALFQPNTVNPETIFVEVLDHLMAWGMWGMIGGAECRVRVAHMRLCYLSSLPRSCIKWEKDIWLQCNSLNEEFVMESWFPIMSCLRAHLGSPSASRMARIIISMSLLPLPG